MKGWEAFSRPFVLAVSSLMRVDGETYMRFFWLLTILLFTQVAHAKPGTMTLQEMVKYSPVIGVCRVESVEWVQGLKFARVVVVRPLRGCKEGQQFPYLAESTWTCDPTNATLHETALLFLHPLKENPFGDYLKEDKERRKQFATAQQNDFRGRKLYGVVHSGNGRMSLKSWGGKEYIERQWCVQMPNVGTFYDPAEPKRFERRRYAPLEPVLAYIRKTPFIRGKAIASKK
jgi:hypothetical protein